MDFAVLEDLPHAFPPRFQEHLPGALAPGSRQEAYQKLVAGEGAVGHVVEGQGVGELAGAVELQAIGEQEQADLRAGDGVVAVGDGVDDGFVDHVEVVGGAVFAERPLTRHRLHEAGDEGDASVDLVGDGAGEPFRVDEVVGGQPGSPVAGGFDGAGGEEPGRLRSEDQQAGDGRPVHSVFVPVRHAGIPEQVEPGDGRRSAEERFEPVAVEVIHGRGEDGLFVEHVLAARCWKSRASSGGVRSRFVDPSRA